MANSASAAASCANNRPRKNSLPSSLFLSFIWRRKDSLSSLENQLGRSIWLKDEREASKLQVKCGTVGLEYELAATGRRFRGEESSKIYRLNRLSVRKPSGLKRSWPRTSSEQIGTWLCFLTGVASQHSRCRYKCKYEAGGTLTLNLDRSEKSVTALSVTLPRVCSETETKGEETLTLVSTIVDG